MSPTSPRLSAGARQAASSYKLHRGSHHIHKQASSSSSTNSSAASSSSSGLTTTTTINNNNNNNTAAAAAHRPPPRHQKQQQPVIIYTHSPKVIRTNPRDFMSIVQKLTGLEGSAATRAAGASSSSSPPPAANNAGSAVTSQDESSSSTESCTYMDPAPMQPPLGAHFMPEIPLFAPAATSDLLCASRGLYGGPFPPVMSSTSINSAVVSGGTVFSPPMAED